MPQKSDGYRETKHIELSAEMCRGVSDVANESRRFAGRYWEPGQITGTDLVAFAVISPLDRR